MAIKILKPGVKPGEVVYRAKCGGCHAELEWQKKDAKRSHEGDQRDGPFTQITCPTCGYTVTGYPPVTLPTAHRD